MTIEMTRPAAVRRTVDATPLRRLCGGDVHLPGDPGYDAARLPWSAAVDQRPAAVVFPRSATDVSEVVRAAAGLGLRVAPQSTGHNAGPLAAQGLDDVVVVRTSGLDEVTVDVERQVVRVGGGVVWEPAVDAAADAGFTVLHGSSPDVGIAGYSLGGGTGWYARKLGLAANNLTAVELVTATGTIVRASADENAPLFWALRGGGGSFGVVTALEFRMFDFDTAYAGMMVWDVRHAEAVLGSWAAWAPDAPDEVTTAFRILRIPPLPEMPEPMRGRELVVIDGAVLDTDERARELLAGLRALGPEMDTFARVPTRTLTRLHMDPEGPTPVTSGTTMLSELPEDAIAAFLEHVGAGATTSLLMAEIRQLGGALGRPHPGGGALSHFEGRFLVFAGAIAATPELGAIGHADATRLVEALAPWANGRSYLNFAEDPVDVRSGFAERSWIQLTGIRSAVDPDGLFVGNHPVPRLFEDGRATA
jgi:FAD/FMN-containing dehydrogenase